MSVDPITVELLRNRIASIMEEMDYHFFRSGYSTIVRESRDFSCVVVDAQGRILVAPWLFVHGAVYYYCVQRIFDVYGAEELAEGDVFVTNHPYEGMMPHASDMGFFAPIFYDGELVAFAGTIAHKADVGGTVPGSTYGSATELYHEGLMLPPIRIHRAGEPIEDVLRLIAANTRAPYVMMGDISGQIGVTRIARRQIHDMCDRFGGDIVTQAMHAMIDASTKEFEAALGNVPDGVAQAEGFLDHDGVDVTRKIRLHVCITIKDGRVHFDFSDSDPQTQGPVNLRLATVESCVFFCLLGMIDPNLRYSDGMRDLISFKFAEKSVLSAEAPRPCSSYIKCCHKVMDITLMALDQILPGRAIANSGGSGGSIIVAWKGDTRRKRGNQYEIFGSAYGAGDGVDGASGITVNLNNLYVAPVEIIEAEFPCRIRSFEMSADSGGAGEFRGGLSFRRTYELLEPAEIIYRSDRAIVPSQGLRGGMSGGRSRFIVNPGTPEAKEMPSTTRLHLEAGEKFSVQPPGGGGYGDPAKRDPLAISDDIAEGFVTEKAATQEYGYQS
jgi:N-methylhydantoinase B